MAVQAKLYDCDTKKKNYSEKKPIHTEILQESKIADVTHNIKENSMQAGPISGSKHIRTKSDCVNYAKIQVPVPSGGPIIYKPNIQPVIPYYIPSAAGMVRKNSGKNGLGKTEENSLAISQIQNKSEFHHKKNNNADFRATPEKSSGFPNKAKIRETVMTTPASPTRGKESHLAKKSMITGESQPRSLYEESKNLKKSNESQKSAEKEKPKDKDKDKAKAAMHRRSASEGVSEAQIIENSEKKPKKHAKLMAAIGKNSSVLEGLKKAALAAKKNTKAGNETIGAALRYEITPEKRGTSTAGYAADKNCKHSAVNASGVIRPPTQLIKTESKKKVIASAAQAHVHHERSSSHQIKINNFMNAPIQENFEIGPKEIIIHANEKIISNRYDSTKKEHNIEPPQDTDAIPLEEKAPKTTKYHIYESLSKQHGKVQDEELVRVGKNYFKHHGPSNSETKQSIIGSSSKIIISHKQAPSFSSIKQAKQNLEPGVIHNLQNQKKVTGGHTHHPSEDMSKKISPMNNNNTPGRLTSAHSPAPHKEKEKDIERLSKSKAHIIEKKISASASKEKSSSSSAKIILSSKKMQPMKGNIPPRQLKGESIEQPTISPLTSTSLDKLSKKNDIERISNYISTYFKKHNDAPPTITEFYRIGKLLGKGAFGKVNLGIHKLTGKMVAIKSISKEFLTDSSSKKKVMQEFSILKQIRHPSIIQLYETFESSKHILFVIELCGGGDLLNYVRKRRKLKENVAKYVLKQLIDGLHYCHSKGILHRDIKLDNILLNGEGDIKICDFGVSKQVKSGERMTEQCGTPAYIAPEILRDKGYEGFNVDIWSAGVVLFAMLYGTVPFKANNMHELHKLIIKGKYTLKEDISEEARDLLKKLLEPDPRLRISIPNIYKHPWMKDIEDGLGLFTEAEKETVKKEYCLKKKTGDGENDTLFTEQNIDSTQNELTKNVTTKSVILAPFNSTITNKGSSLEIGKNCEIYEKKRVIHFSAKVRDADRQYEKNNNGELDNGVYNKFVCASSSKNGSHNSSSDSLNGSFKEKEGHKDNLEDVEEPKESSRLLNSLVTGEEQKSPCSKEIEAVQSRATGIKYSGESTTGHFATAPTLVIGKNTIIY